MFKKMLLIFVACLCLGVGEVNAYLLSPYHPASPFFMPKIHGHESSNDSDSQNNSKSQDKAKSQDNKVCKSCNIKQACQSCNSKLTPKTSNTNSTDTKETLGRTCLPKPDITTSAKCKQKNNKTVQRETKSELGQLTSNDNKNIEQKHCNGTGGFICILLAIIVGLFMFGSLICLYFDD